MIQRDLPFDRLNIDFEKLKRRKAAEYEKLQAVVDYAQSSRCRQSVILQYFGDPQATVCGTCDNCRAHPQHADRGEQAGGVEAAAAPDGVLRAVRMALSGVARTEGRFGKQVIAQMLWGSKSAKLARWKLQQLSTYGLMKDITCNEVVAVLDAMLGVGLVEQEEVDRFRPVLKLTSRGKEVMQGSAALPPNLRLPQELSRKLEVYFRALEEERTPRPAPAPPIAPAQPPSPALRKEPDDADWTYDAAKDAWHYEPNAEVSTSSVPNDAASDSRATTAPPRDDGDRPDHYWTWRLLYDGFSRAECRQIRRISDRQVVEHLHRALEDGLPVDPGWAFSADQLAAIERVVRTCPESEVRRRLDRLAVGMTREQLDLFLRCRGGGS